MMDLSPSTNGIWEINAGSSCNLRLQLLGLASGQVLISTLIIPVGRTGAVVSVANYRPRGPWFETWPLGRRSFT